MSWSTKRQLMYSTIILVFLVLVIGIPVYFIYFNHTPTCFDGIKNLDETGIDCGGSCSKSCLNEVVNMPITDWARAFKVTDGIYNLVAEIENPNVKNVAGPTPYQFRVYDTDNVLIAVREGVANVPASKIFPIFEQTVKTGQRVPGLVFFEFTSTPDWKKYDGLNNQLFDITDEAMTDASSSPVLRAGIYNKSNNSYKNVEVVAIIYGKDGNAMAASRTTVDVLPAQGSSPLVFTWPEAFPSDVSRIEVIPKTP